MHFLRRPRASEEPWRDCRAGLLNFYNIIPIHEDFEEAAKDGFLASGSEEMPQAPQYLVAPLS